MSQGVKRKNLGISSLRTRQSAHTVLLQMAADQARADRIRQLKLAHPEFTWRAIADHVGVSERSAIDWQKTGGIEYEHAKKLAELFPEVSLDYLWRGEAPDLLGTMNGDVPEDLQAQLTRMQQELREVHELLAEFTDAWATQALPTLDALRAEAATRKQPSRATPRAGRAKRKRAQP